MESTILSKSKRALTKASQATHKPPLQHIKPHILHHAGTGQFAQILYDLLWLFWNWSATTKKSLMTLKLYASLQDGRNHGAATTCNNNHQYLLCWHTNWLDGNVLFNHFDDLCFLLPLRQSIAPSPQQPRPSTAPQPSGGLSWDPQVAGSNAQLSQKPFMQYFVAAPHDNPFFPRTECNLLYK